MRGKYIYTFLDEELMAKCAVATTEGVSTIPEVTVMVESTVLAHCNDGERAGLPVTVTVEYSTPTHGPGILSEFEKRRLVSQF